MKTDFKPALSHYESLEHNYKDEKNDFLFSSGLGVQIAYLCLQIHWTLSCLFLGGFQKRDIFGTYRVKCEVGMSLPQEHT